MSFVSEPVLPSPQQAGKAWCFVFRGDGLLVKATGDTIAVPSSSDIAGLRGSLLSTHYLGLINDMPCFAAEVQEIAVPPEGMSFQGLRSLLGILREEQFSLAGRALQILDWNRTHRFCTRCGVPMEPKVDERAKVCPECGLLDYPIISPAIIVAVIRDQEILLARGRHFSGDFYSVLAGFVEPGETFEECVRREVKEEAGIDVDNIRYFGSQPWPFPHSLMVGFAADYVRGEVMPDESEIIHAGWFRHDDLPAIPRKGTIARSLIDWFVENAAQRKVSL